MTLEEIYEFSGCPLLFGAEAELTEAERRKFNRETWSKTDSQLVRKATRKDYNCVREFKQQS